MRDTFATRSPLTVGHEDFTIFSLARLGERFDLKRLPFSMKILLENLLRNEDGVSVTAEHIRAVAEWDGAKEPDTEIAFMPARVVLQDFTGVPCVVDLAAMRDAMAQLGGDPSKINPLVPVELVIDHSVQVDVFGTADLALADWAIVLAVASSVLVVEELRKLLGRARGARAPCSVGRSMHATQS